MLDQNALMDDVTIDIDKLNGKAMSGDVQDAETMSFRTENGIKSLVTFVDAGTTGTDGEKVDPPCAPSHLS